MIPYLRDYVIPAAYSVLPAAMGTEPAMAMLLAIALQESKAANRFQIGGPAKGFWQFEAGGGVYGVLSHGATQKHARLALTFLCYPASMTSTGIHAVLEHNDVLAAVFARLLLWTVPASLPGQHEPEKAWSQYLDAWRPGRPHPLAWPENYAVAWDAVGTRA